MKYLENFNDFKLNNITGDIINQDDIIECINKKGFIYSDIIQNYGDNNPNEPLSPVDIEDDNITVIFNSNEYNVKLKDVKKITW